jgi:hypothetical protein
MSIATPSCDHVKISSVRLFLNFFNVWHMAEAANSRNCAFFESWRTCGMCKSNPGSTALILPSNVLSYIIAGHFLCGYPVCEGNRLTKFVVVLRAVPYCLRPKNCFELPSAVTLQDEKDI